MTAKFKPCPNCGVQLPAVLVDEMTAPPTKDEDVSQRVERCRKPQKAGAR